MVGLSSQSKREINTSLSPCRINGLWLIVCGLIETKQIAFALGCIIGPPLDRAYAVDPVGVVTIIPSAL